jgi:hypothetical protein
LCLASALLAASTPIFADSSRDPAITEARADGGLLHILGLNLGGARPQVTLGTLSLSVVSVTATQIDALVPASVVPGSYLLTVTFGKSKSGGDDEGKSDEFWVTIGAAGPTGATGAAGPAGVPGPSGPVGAQGAQGSAGLAGSPGLAGPAGAQGPAGPAGAQGPVGPAGAQGPAGPAGARGATGATGPQGPAGAAGTLTSFLADSGPPRDITVFDGEVTLVATCPSGSVVTGGGYYVNFSTVTDSRQQGNAWAVTATTAGALGPSFQAHATCLRLN